MSDILDSNMVNPNEKKDKKEGEEKAKDSLKFDKRSNIKYYYSLLKKNQLILFAFFS